MPAPYEPKSLVSSPSPLPNKTLQNLLGPGLFEIDGELVAFDHAHAAIAEFLMEDALAQSELEQGELQARLAVAVLSRDALEAELDAARAESADAERARATLEDRLAEALLANEELQARVDSLSGGDTLSIVIGSIRPATVIEAPGIELVCVMLISSPTAIGPKVRRSCRFCGWSKV